MKLQSLAEPRFGGEGLANLENAIAKPPINYCYLALAKESSWPDLIALLGPNPKLRSLLKVVKISKCILSEQLISVSQRGSMVHLANERFEGQGVVTAEEGVMMLQAITAQDSQVTIGNDSIYCEEGYCYTTLLPPWHRRQAMIDLGKSPKICELFQYVTEKNIDVTNCKVDYSYWGNILHVWPAKSGGVTLVTLKRLYCNGIRIGQGVITLGTCKIVSPR